VNNVSRPLPTGLATAAALAVAVAAAAGSALPASASELMPASHVVHTANTANTANTAEWWLPALAVSAAWRVAPGEGKGAIVAVLSTGVDGSHPDLTGTVTNGPDFAKTGRGPGQEYWADEGTAVASLIAGHGHGVRGSEGITGIAPLARILSVQVTLEYDDPQDSDAAITDRLPAAIAAGIRYAVDHGASIISLPLDPGTMSTAGNGNTAADGNRAERAAVAYAISRDVLLVAPAGDNGGVNNAVNYPAAYPGVIAVGATSRDGELAPFTNTGSYVALTAPGASGPPVAPDPDAAMAGRPPGLTVAAPGGEYQILASTDMSAAFTAGVAALIRGRYPWLTTAEVTNAIEDSATAPASATPSSATSSSATSSSATSSSATTDSAATTGRGHGALNAARALTRAAAIAVAHPRPPTQTASAPALPTAPPATAPASAAPATATATATATSPGDPGGTVRSVLLDVLVGACVLIAGLVCALTVTWLRRRAGSARAADATGTGRNRSPGRHSRAQPTPAPPVQPPHNPEWAWNPPRPVSGAGSAWANATPGPRPTTDRSADAQRPPWEQPPTVFASAPVPKAPPPWPLSSSGPMYVWNPDATTGPLNTTDE
jgi:Subtilase family